MHTRYLFALRVSRPGWSANDNRAEPKASVQRAQGKRSFGVGDIVLPQPEVLNGRADRDQDMRLAGVANGPPREEHFGTVQPDETRATTGLGSPPGRVAKLKGLIGAQVAIHELDGPVLSGDQRPQKGGRVMVVLCRLLRFSAFDRRPPHKVVHPGESVQPLWLWDLRPYRNNKGDP